MAENTFIEIQEIRELNPSTYMLKFGRNNIQFQAGRYIGLGLKDYPNMKDYSIYSGENDDFLEVLVREILDGDLSIKFKKCKVGDCSMVYEIYDLLKDQGIDENQVSLEVYV